ncbi:hypothetical protein [Lactobacillus sp. PV034]|uniref:hypothetical protein n=1 Tax=Lactobacillus sp. PV034 TaxID=2594495 RepID=UPI00223FA3ED|nr:hypothetical protein [Lactobacillus sp. PV034]QNQ80666.1 hypothetical protein FP432_03425 [Lactobacillus sp. PV034]
MAKNNEKFQEMESTIYNFAKDLFFKNEAMADLVSLNAQKDLLTLKEEQAQKMQEIRATLIDFCQPQVKAIIEVSKNAKDIKPDFQLVKNQVHQLLQNYDNLIKLISYVKEVRAKKGHSLTHQWQEMTNRIDQMNIDSIKQINLELN